MTLTTNTLKQDSTVNQDNTANQKSTANGGGISVSGLVVHSSPKKLDLVQESLGAIHGVEVHAAAPEGKLVVTVEEQSGQKTMVDTITQISHVEGVISTALVYTHNDAWSEE